MTKDKANAKMQIDKMLKNKFMILPGTLIKIGKAFSEITPDIIKEEVAYHAQKRKRGWQNTKNMLI